MNSAQRRKAYRAMPSIGARVFWASGMKEGVVVDLKRAHHGQWNEERNNVPSVHRVRIECRTPEGNVYHVHPLLKRIQADWVNA
ncbi:hypothetical protein [Paraburkholderia hospita]|uniref:hypothetical protein n=1 Tax=Paraburkholderia hospita TaxID=169430 RepID=UPI000B34645F|nr:hypothetical protein [Paraburkholderia hospita]OUL79898.1 hypothetical protein CA603_33000 [Paraburkholderia hospita]